MWGATQRGPGWSAVGPLIKLVEGARKGIASRAQLASICR